MADTRVLIMDEAFAYAGFDSKVMVEETALAFKALRKNDRTDADGLASIALEDFFLFSPTSFAPWLRHLMSKTSKMSQCFIFSLPFSTESAYPAFSLKMPQSAL